MTQPIALSKETRRAFRMQDLQLRLGPRLFALLRTRLRGKSFYPATFHEKKVIFVHVPKVAGTSLGEAMFGTGRTGHFEWNLYRAESPEAFDSYFKFGFVREPVSRFLSAYNYLLEGGKSVSDLKAGEDIRAYGEVTDFLRDGLLRDRWTRWVHFRPQANFLCDASGRSMVDFIGRHETFATDCEIVAERMGQAFTPDHQNRTTRAGILREDLSSEALEILSKVYARDFAAFNYPVPERE